MIGDLGSFRKCARHAISFGVQDGCHDRTVVDKLLSVYFIYNSVSYLYARLSAYAFCFTPIISRSSTGASFATFHDKRKRLQAFTEAIVLLCSPC